MTEFRRASSELKATFDREMKTLEQETESIKEVANEYQYDTYNYDYSSYEANYEGSIRLGKLRFHRFHPIHSKRIRT